MCPDIYRMGSEGSREMGQWAFQTSGQVSAAVAEELCKWGVGWHTTQTLWNCRLKQWVFHGSCTQTHVDKTRVRTLREGFGCLFLTITTACFHTARGCYPMLDCPLHRLLPQILPWEIFTQQDTQECLHFLEQQQGYLRVLWKSHNGTFLRHCSSKQVSPFHILLKSEGHFSALEVSLPRSCQSHS